MRLSVLLYEAYALVIGWNKRQLSKQNGVDLNSVGC